MVRRSKVVLLFVLLASLLITESSPAWATGGVICRVDDRNMRFSLHAPYSRGGGGFFNVTGELEIRAPQAPRDFRRLRLTKDDLVHHWFEGGSTIKLEIYREREGAPFGYVRLVIDTRGDLPGLEEGGYRGTYRLTISDGVNAQRRDVNLRGRVKCSAD